MDEQTMERIVREAVVEFERDTRPAPMEKVRCRSAAEAAIRHALAMYEQALEEDEGCHDCAIMSVAEGYPCRCLRHSAPLEPPKEPCQLCGGSGFRPVSDECSNHENGCQCLACRPIRCWSCNPRTEEE